MTVSGRPGPIRPEGLAPLGAGLAAYAGGDRDSTLRLRWDLAGEEEVDLSIFFDHPVVGVGVEGEALRRATGSVLDVGAGAGRFSVAMMARGQSVLALEVIPEAVSILEARGVPTQILDVYQTGHLDRFDTVLVMMNGAALAGTLAGLPRFLAVLSDRVRPGGRILIDSTDPFTSDLGWDVPDDGRYRGELQLQIGFEGIWGPPVPQLYVDPERLSEAARSVGLRATVEATSSDGRYLVELVGD